MESNAVKTDKNWNDLPVELKVKCIKKMDFKTRWNLRSTTRVEKELVEGTKCPGEYLEPDTFKNRPCVVIYTEDEDNVTYLPIDGKIMETVIKMGYFYTVHADNETCLEIIHGTSQNIRWDVEFLVLKISSSESLSIVDKCRGLNEVSIKFVPGQFHSELIKFSDVSAASENIFKLDFVYLKGICSMEPIDVVQLIEMWIAVDKEPSEFEIKFRIHFSSLEFLDKLKTILNGRHEIASEYDIDDAIGIYIPFGEKYICVEIRSDNILIKVTNDDEDHILEEMDTDSGNILNLGEDDSSDEDDWF